MMAGHSLKPIAKGLLTWIPGVQRAFFDAGAGGGTADANYCYGVWLKHLAMLSAGGLPEPPRAVLELGPGDSLGTGIATMLSGAQRYVAIDKVPHANGTRDKAVLRELLRLFARRAPRPRQGWPDFDAHLDERLFPGGMLTEERLGRALAPARVDWIRHAVGEARTAAPTRAIRYRGWDMDDGSIETGMDLVFSHVVLELVDDLEQAYAHFARVLRPGGWMSHQIDFSSHDITREWNGHWRFGEAAWRLVTGRRPFFVNRAPLSAHLALLERHGFELQLLERLDYGPGLARDELAPRWRALSDEDLRIGGAFLVARKPAAPPAPLTSPARSA